MKAPQLSRGRARGPHPLPEPPARPGVPRGAGAGVGPLPAQASYRLSVRTDTWFISLFAIKFLISEK